MARVRKNHNSNPKTSKPKVAREQPKKDSRSKRVNFDNARIKRVEEEIKSGKFNDIAWYVKNAETFAAASSLPILPILGSLVCGAPVPGIMVIPWTPAFGPNQAVGYKQYGSPTATNKLKLTPGPVALNQAADSTYSFIVHANSRNYNYNSSDLWMLIQAGIEVFDIITAMTRGYGYARNYEEQSLYTPDTVLAAMGFAPQDLKDNLAQAWFDLNRLIDQSRQIWIPTSFPILRRWSWLESNVFRDAGNGYSQLYVPVRTHYYKYDETGVSAGGCIRRASEPGQPNNVFNPVTGVYSWKTWVTVAQDMINALVEAEDRGIIYGDLLNAYGSERIYALPSVSSDYRVEPIYSEEMLMQIENIKPSAVSPIGLVQCENRLFPMWGGTIGTDATEAPPEDAIINFHFTNPSRDALMEATRAMTLGTYAAYVPTITNTSLTSTTKWIPRAVGSEVFEPPFIYTHPYDKSQSGKQMISAQLNMTAYGLQTGQFELMAFDWHPFLYKTSADPSTPVQVPTDAQALSGLPLSYKTIKSFGDFDVYSSIDVTELEKLHLVAMFGLFDVPQM